ncbi:MAG: HAMP domain-containing sensor histidine kinase [Erythrobacter sp.]
MSQTTLLSARGILDERGQLLSADQSLSDLQARCGGSIPGMLAVPELLDLVRHARTIGLAIARNFTAFDGDDRVEGMVRITPLGDDNDGACELVIENMSRTLLEAGDEAELARMIDSIDRATAEITARLDRRQRAQFWDVSAKDAGEFSALIDQHREAMWDDHIELIGISHQQPLHWRLLDGVQCRVPGSQRVWRLRLLPLGQLGATPSGFELLLIPLEPLSERVASDGSVNSGGTSIGSTLSSALRKPVARVIANAETMRARLAGPLKAEYSEYAGNVASAGQHLAGMLDDLVDLEAVESDGFSTLDEVVDLNEAANKAAQILGVRAQNRGIELDVTGATDLFAIGELRRIIQIAINLIGNAIAYAPEQSCVTVLTYTSADVNTVCLSVADEGSGISNEQAARVFNKFERLGRENDGGSGLGLYISRKLARAMGGELSVESVEGEGATFVLSLPRSR